MLNKIAFKTLRQKWRDYSILLIGTTITVAIFYMFSNIAMNDTLLKSLSSVTQKTIVIVFMLGQILLGVITFIYLNFANNFLIQLRQKDYGIISMLGATKRQLGSLLMRETLLIGAVASILGIILGMGLTQLSGKYLMQAIDVKITAWSNWSTQGALVTIVFFLVICFLNGLYNRWRLMHLDTLTLLKADQSVKVKPAKPKRQFVLGLLGLIILGLSFAMMPQVTKWQIPGLVVDLILNVIGTYLFVGQTLGLVTNWLSHADFAQKGLRSFLNGQLRFRLDDYKRVLTMISVLFGLALGAISVGQGYYVTLPQQAVQNDSFTLAVENPKADFSGLKDVTYNQELAYTIKNRTVYFDKQQVAQAKVPTLQYDHTKSDVNAKPKRTTLDVNHPDAASDLTMMNMVNYVTKQSFDGPFEPYEAKLVDHLPAGKQKSLKIVKVKNLAENEPALKKIKQAEQAYTGNHEVNLPGAYGTLVMLKGVFGGLEFMSIFLGIAFLVMLASTLMFKTLTSVSADRRRYEILSMIGSTPHKLTMTTFQDTGILFLVPMVIGLADVSFGLQIFKPIMSDPYSGLALGCGLVLGIYGIYYLLTSLIYRHLVLKK
ncbi:putative ABC transport system permease protein [Weissella uvarum]|uniref:ABC transporter permease n=1 Tax=Weissella uvarum TaxID=1479233 RepID=UPI001961A797|nr:ABC transporter permease [Weissella uvarum]MBM7617342.1 putative ABC transport system permease protein [Weissella uvarum]MCM0595766.1 ABC transporter permease [Weissella uvarum]